MRFYRTIIFYLDAKDVLKKAKETTLKLEEMSLKVESEFEPTIDKGILLASNLNSKTGKETLKNFIEVKKEVEVLNVVFGKDSKAIVILKGR